MHQTEEPMTNEYSETETPALRRSGTKKKRKLPIHVLLCYLIACTLVASGVTFSAYVTTTTDSDEARVAKFDVKEDGVSTMNISLGNMTPGTTKEHTFTVTNDSEVSVACLVDVSTTGNLPLTFAVSAAGEETKIIEPGKPVKMEKISYGGAGVTYTLSVTWPTDKNNAEYAELIDAVKLIVTVQQAD